MRNGTRVLQRRMVPHYNAMIAFGRTKPDVPRAQVIDLRCQDYDHLKTGYRTLIQSLRMVDCKGRNRWGRDIKQWSVVVMAMDNRKRILFIHSRSPYTMHDFVAMLLRLPLGLRTTIYLEGGPEATLYLNAGGVKFQKVGSYETGFNENNDNRRAWRLPNVIGIVARN